MFNERHGQNNWDAIPIFLLDILRPEDCESLPTYWEIGGRRPRKFLPLYHTNPAKCPEGELEHSIIQVLYYQSFG